MAVSFFFGKPILYIPFNIDYHKFWDSISGSGSDSDSDSDNNTQSQ